MSGREFYRAKVVKTPRSDEKMKRWMIYPGMLVGILSIGGSSGREITSFERLVARDGLFYEVGSGEPFTGRVITYHANGQKKVAGEYFEGKREGKWIEWFETGKVKSESGWRGNEQDGKWTRWYENGQMQEEGEYRAGEEDGKWSAWYENGQKESETRWQNGSEVSRTKWDTNGNLIQPPQPQPSPSPVT